MKWILIAKEVFFACTVLLSCNSIAAQTSVISDPFTVDTRTVKVRFVANGGEFRRGDGSTTREFVQYFGYGTSQKLFTDDLVPQKPGNVFLGWALDTPDIDSSYSIIGRRAERTWNNNVTEVTFYAVWTSTITVSFCNNGDDLVPPTLTNHVFWSVDGNLAGNSTRLRSGESAQVGPGKRTIAFFVDEAYRSFARELEPEEWYLQNYDSASRTIRLYVSNDYRDPLLYSSSNEAKYPISVNVAPPQGRVCLVWFECAGENISGVPFDLSSVNIKLTYFGSDGSSEPTVLDGFSGNWIRYPLPWGVYRVEGKSRDGKWTFPDLDLNLQETIRTVYLNFHYMGADSLSGRTITLDAGYGTVDPKQMDVYAHASVARPWMEIPQLPTPTFAGHTFFGWRTGKNGKGRLVEAGTKFYDGEVGDKTLYAHWDIHWYDHIIYGLGNKIQRILSNSAAYSFVLTGEVDGTVEIPDNAGVVTIDLNGYSITGQSGEPGTADSSGGPAIRVVRGDGEGEPTTLVIVDTSEGESGRIVGGGDGAGIEVESDAASGVNIDVDENVSVFYGNGTEQPIGSQVSDWQLPDYYQTYFDGTYTWVYRYAYQDDGYVTDGVVLTGFYQYNNPDNPDEGGSSRCGVNPIPAGHVDIPDAIDGLPVLGLDVYLFYGCDKLSSVSIPETVEMVGFRAFCESDVTTVHLPDTVRFVDDGAFECTPLEYVNVPRDIEFVGGYAFFDTPWQAAQGDFAFFGDGNLIAYQGTETDVTLPESVRTVCGYAFDSFPIESVSIPASVERIDDWAFDGCENLADVVFEGDMWNVGMNVKYAFEGTTWLANFECEAPDNDDFANAQVIAGSGGTVNGRTCAATIEEGEPAVSTWNSIASVWYSWTAPSSGEATFDTIGSTFDTVLGVYTGSSVAGLTAVAEDDDSGARFYLRYGISCVTFDAIAGTTYNIAVAGYRREEGFIALNWSMPGYGPDSEFEPALEPEEPSVVCGEVEGAAPLAAASEYNGYLYDSAGNVKGTIQVKVAKPNAKTGLAAVKATVQLVGSKKKLTLKAADGGKAKLVNNGTTTIVLAGGETCEIVLGENGVAGYYGSLFVDGARNFFASKDKAEQNAANAALAKLPGAVNVKFDGGTATLVIAKKGKVKASIVLDNGTKESGNTQILVGEDGWCIPVVAPKKANVAFAVWFAEDGGITVAGLPGAVAGTVRTPGASLTFAIDGGAEAWIKAGLPGETDFLPDGFVFEGGAKWKFDKADSIKYKDGAFETVKDNGNPSGLKLTYKAKDGSFKGSFKAYAVVNGKLKKHTVNVTGVMIGGKGYGSATIKKIGSVAITIK